MIIPSSTLFRYVSKHFIMNLLIMMLVLVGIMMIFEVIELLRRSSSDNNVSFNMIILIASLKMPYLGTRILPMGVLFSAIYTCWKLNKTSELIVMRSSGLSAWQFLTPILFCGFLIGVFSTAVINPISAVFLAKHDQMNKVYIEGDINLATVSKTGIWLRQPTDNGGYALMHASKLDPKSWKMNNVTILFFDNSDSFIKRVDSKVVFLKDKYWDIKNPLINDVVEGAKQKDFINISTELTSQQIEESFSDPETIAFWSIAEYIEVMEETGFPATRIYMHFHKLFAQPFLFVALILLAASFSLRPARFGTTAYMIAFGITVGFMVFFMESVLGAFGISHKIPIYLAAWSPSIIGLLIGGTSLLHLEDG